MYDRDNNRDEETTILQVLFHHNLARYGKSIFVAILQRKILQLLTYTGR